MTTLVLISAAGGLAVLLLGLALLVFALRAASTSEVQRRINEYVEVEPAPLRPAGPDPFLGRRNLEGSLSSRVLLPWFHRLGRLFGRLTPAKALEELQRQMAIAGRPLGLGPREFYGLRLVFSLVGYWLAFITLRSGFTQRNLLFAGLVLIVCTYLPKSWLRSRVRARQEKVRKGLPDALDMLSVCAEAGLGFDQSLQRVAEYWKTPVGVEFGRVVQEMEMGSSRRQALRDLAERLDISELSSFVAVILQSDQLGMSISETLTGQARQMRDERRFRAQEQARKIPLKMLFPMLLLILPAMFAVVLGPSIPAISMLFDTMLSNMP